MSPQGNFQLEVVLGKPLRSPLSQQGLCSTCATYMLHLVQGMNARELVPKPEGVNSALDEAWPDIVMCICYEVACAVDEANQTINRLNGDLSTLKNNGD